MRMRLCLSLSALVFSLNVLAADTIFGIIGDAGKTTSGAKQVRDSMIRQKVFKTVLPGDNLYSGTYDSVWTIWKTSGFTFDVVAIGNHSGGYPKEIAFFKMPSEYYAKVIDGTKFLVLNSDNNNSGPQQAAWLNSELDKATEKLIFLVYHHPSYTISTFHNWEEKKKFQNAIRPVIWKNRSKITALIVGHDHLASLLHFNDLPVILSGAVQEFRKDKPVDYTSNSIHIKTNWYFDSKPYWAKLTVNAALGKAAVDYMRASDDKISCSATIETGHSAQMAANCNK